MEGFGGGLWDGDIPGKKFVLTYDWASKLLSLNTLPRFTSERKGNHLNGFQDFSLKAKARLKPRPENGLDCLTYADVALQRSAPHPQGTAGRM